VVEERPVPFEWVDHTADLGVALAGDGPEQVYARALLATAALLVGDSPVRPEAERRVEVEGDDRVERLVSLAGELIYLWDVEAFVPARAEVTEDGRRVRAILSGETFDPERHWVEREVKAVTFHEATFSAAPGGGWQAHLLFDL